MKLALTVGEPAGIGPDLILQLKPQELPCPLVIFGDPRVLQARAKLLNLPFAWEEYAGQTQVKQAYLIYPVPQAEETFPGQLNVANIHGVLSALDLAVKGCLNHEFSAVITGPVHKGIINQGGIPFTGQTEFVAKQCEIDEPVMMLVSGDLRVALVTTHLPLSKVALAITPHKVELTIRTVHHDLIKRFGIENPRLLVCGLNPHAGEGGYLGREEIECIIPVVEKLRKENITLIGPVPADTAFTPKLLLQADAVITMYHDQGLPVLKYHGFGSGVNVTLGLPIIRTSVDHGTALDIAGQGTGEAGSLQMAIQLAQRLSVNKL